MTLSKRVFDIVLAALLSVALLPVILGLSLWLLIRQGRPVFYVAERMKTPTRAFALWKFRSMTRSAPAKASSTSPSSKNTSRSRLPGRCSCRSTAPSA